MIQLLYTESGTLLYGIYYVWSYPRQKKSKKMCLELNVNLNLPVHAAVHFLNIKPEKTNVRANARMLRGVSTKKKKIRQIFHGLLFKTDIFSTKLFNDHHIIVCNYN